MSGSGEEVRAVLLTVGRLLGGVGLGELRGQQRWLGFVLARKAAALALRRRKLSYPEIGKALGGRHHTSAMGLVRSAVALEKENARFAAAVADGVRVGGRPACSGACEPACPVCAAECGAADGVGGESCIGLA